MPLHVVALILLPFFSLNFHTPLHFLLFPLPGSGSTEVPRQTVLMVFRRWLKPGRPRQASDNQPFLGSLSRRQGWVLRISSFYFFGLSGLSKAN